MPSSVDVAIVGAGLGGLMTAVRLAKAGKKVAILDKHYVAGGCATMFARGPAEARYVFDVGLHYVGECQPGGRLSRLLEEVDVPITWNTLDPDGFDELVFPDFRFRVPASLELYRDRLVAQFPSEKRGIDRYVRLLVEVRKLGRPDAPRGWKLAFEALTGGRLAAANRSATLAQFLDTCTQDRQLRAIIAGQNGDYGLPPSKVSLMLHAGLANHYFGGAYYPKGGGQVIADGLAAKLEELGGTVHLRHGVENIVVADGRVSGVAYRTPHGEAGFLPAKAVVAAGDLKRTILELLPQDQVPAAQKAKAEAWEMGGALYLLALAVKADLGKLGMGATNYWQFDSYDFDTMYGEINTTPNLPPVRGCYITSATRKDPGTPGHAPEGIETVEVMALVPGMLERWGVAPADAESTRYRAAKDYVGHKERVETDLIRRLEQLFPGSTRDIVYREGASPVTQTRFTGASGGTSYGLAATPEQFMANRPGYRGFIPGLFFAGANTRAGHGIVGALASGGHAARTVLKGG
jgi:phytoene dehydrogenase-like protein